MPPPSKASQGVGRACGTGGFWRSCRRPAAVAGAGGRPSRVPLRPLCAGPGARRPCFGPPGPRPGDRFWHRGLPAFPRLGAVARGRGRGDDRGARSPPAQSGEDQLAAGDVRGHHGRAGGTVGGSGPSAAAADTAWSADAVWYSRLHALHMLACNRQQSALPLALCASPVDAGPFAHVYVDDCHQLFQYPSLHLFL